jgi:hypothetical protein
VINMRYSGFANRTISVEDWSTVGVKSKEIDVKHGDIIELNDSAAAWLTENEGADWSEVSEKEAAAAAKAKAEAEEPPE